MVVDLESMVSGSERNARQASRLDFQTSHPTGTTQTRAHKAQPSKASLKRPAATPAAVSAANEEAFPLDDNADLGSF